MSFLIQMPQPIQRSQSGIIRLLHQQKGALIHHPEFNMAIMIQQSERVIQLALPKGQLSFIRDTRWKIQILNTNLRFTISFLDYTGLNYMRGQSQRIKLQLIILLRLINNRLPFGEEYFIEPATGIIRYTYTISHKDYEEKLKGVDSLRRLFKYILLQLHLYAEIILFCEPNNQNSQLKPQLQLSELESINRYRFLLMNTGKIREKGIQYIGNMIDIKQQLKSNQNIQQNAALKRLLDQVRYLFQSNLQVYEQMKVGLEDQEKTYEKFSNCLKHIIKNAKGEQSIPLQSKIVKGIKILKNGDIKSISKQGAHSEVFKGKFIYKVSLTINLQVAQSNALWLDGKQLKTELIFKKCKLEEKSSKNSFMNELYLLNHLRDAKSSCIAKYFLQIKDFKDRNESDMIYMQGYSQNVYSLIKNCPILKMKERLSIIYKLSKGLCFLNYWSVLHRDFKPQNIMVDKQLNPFIIDFGSCAPIMKSSNFQVLQERLLATPSFHISYNELPQEYAYLRHKFTREEYNKHPLFDVYSFGRVISYIFFNSIRPPSPDDLGAFPYPELVKNIWFLIDICLKVDPDQRPVFAEITSFIGTLQVYIRSLEKDIDMRSRSI